MLQVTDRIAVPLRELRFEYARSPGPGGQNVNKVNSKAVLRWEIHSSPSISGALRQRFVERFGNRINAAGELMISSARFRDQGRNVADCLEKLRAMLLEVARPPRPRRETKPSAGSRRRRLEGKRWQGEKKRLRQRPGRDD